MNPITYQWCQCDAETYDSNASPEEQAQAEVVRKQYAAQLIAAMRTVTAAVPSYCERYQQAKLVEVEACPDPDPWGHPPYNDMAEFE